MVLKMKQLPFLRVLLLAALMLFCCFSAHAQEDVRALLIGVDEFVTRPATAPSSSNNVTAMEQLLLSFREPVKSILIPEQTVTDADVLSTLIAEAFAGADEDDISCLYLSTHGVYTEGEEPRLLLSDGITESGVTPAQLEKAFENVAGIKLIILDACNSGAFIGKGLSILPEKGYFQGDDFKVITSSGAMEESWYWSSTEGSAQGGFYFTQALVQGLSASAGYPADRNRNGDVTLNELYNHLLANHAASTPQVYPQADDTVIFRYDLQAEEVFHMERSPIVDVTFSGTVLDWNTRQISVEFTATRPVRVAYQVVYQRDGKWQFDEAQLIYDGAERFTAYGDEPGAISAGRKVRAVNLGSLGAEECGYVLVQLVSIDMGVLTVHAGSVICVPPAQGTMTLAVDTPRTFSVGQGHELPVFIAHNYPCTLSVAVVDEAGQVVHRLCHRQSTRPLQTSPEGSTFYWNGLLKDGTPAAKGEYRIRVQAHMNDTTVTALSASFMIE